MTSSSLDQLHPTNTPPAAISTLQAADHERSTAGLAMLSAAALTVFGREHDHWREILSIGAWPPDSPVADPATAAAMLPSSGESAPFVVGHEQHGTVQCAAAWLREGITYMAIAAVRDTERGLAGMAVCRSWLDMLVVGELKSSELARRLARAHAGFMVMRRVAESFTSAENLDDALRYMLSAVVRLLGADGGSVGLVDSETNLLRVQVEVGYPEEYTAGIAQWGVAEGLAGLVIQSGEPMIIEDLLAHPLTARRELHQLARWRSWTGVPLVHDRQVLGIIEILARRPAAIDRHDEELLRTIATQLAYAIQTEELNVELARARAETADAYSGQSLSALREHEVRAEERLRVRKLLMVGSTRLQQLEARVRDAEEDCDVSGIATLAARIRDEYEFVADNLDGAILGGDALDRLREFTRRFSALRRLEITIVATGWSNDLPPTAGAAVVALARDLIYRYAEATPRSGVQVKMERIEGEVIVSVRHGEPARMPPERMLPEHLRLGLLRAHAGRYNATLSVARTNLRDVAICRIPTDGLGAGARLTAREVDVLRLVALGMNSSEVAYQLGMSEKTVRNHLSSLYRKLDVTNRTQAALYAMRMGIVAD